LVICYRIVVISSSGVAAVVVVVRTSIETCFSVFVLVTCLVAYDVTTSSKKIGFNRKQIKLNDKN